MILTYFFSYKHNKIDKYMKFNIYFIFANKYFCFFSFRSYVQNSTLFRNINIFPFFSFWNTMYKLNCSLKICENVLNFNVFILRVVFSLFLFLHHLLLLLYQLLSLLQRLLSFLHCYVFFFLQLYFSHFWGVIKISIEFTFFCFLPCHVLESITVGMNPIVSFANNTANLWQIGLNILPWFKFNVAYTTNIWII